MKTASHALLSALCALCLSQTVSHAQTAALSGTVNYAGRQTGDVWVLAATNSAMPTNLVGFASVKASVSPAIGAFTNVAFTLPGLDTNKNYWLFAWRDSNTNNLNDTTEAKAAFSANPILLTNDVTNAVLTLTDPDANNNAIPDWWEQFYGIVPGFGDGSDGPLVVNAGQTNFTDTVRAVVTGNNPAGSSVVSVATTNGFRTNDLVLIIAMQDPNTDLNQNIAGRYEFARLFSLSNSALVLTGPLSNSFPATASQRIQVLRLPQYGTVTVNGTLTCSNWNGTTGGVLAFLAQSLTIGTNGSVTAEGKGFRGGPDYAQADVDGYQGESFAGTWANRNTANNFGGGGGGGRSWYGGGNGGGGGSYGSLGIVGSVGNSVNDRSTALLGGSAGSLYGFANLGSVNLLRLA